MKTLGYQDCGKYNKGKQKYQDPLKGGKMDVHLPGSSSALILEKKS